MKKPGLLSKLFGAEKKSEHDKIVETYQQRIQEDFGRYKQLVAEWEQARPQIRAERFGDISVLRTIIVATAGEDWKKFLERFYYGLEIAYWLGKVDGEAEITAATPTIPVFTYQGPGVTLKYPRGWKLEPNLAENFMYVWAPSRCCWIQLYWNTLPIPNAAGAEDLYEVTRTLMHEHIMETDSHREQFEILREYRLADGPVFELQFRDLGAKNNVRRYSYVDMETGLQVIFGWVCTDALGDDKLHYNLGLRDALFDVLAQSITFGG